MKSLQREDIRSREKFALTSAMNLSSLYVQGRPDRQGHRQLLIDRVILPYLAAGPVLVAELANFESMNGGGENFLTNDLAYARSKGICFDLNEIYSEEELDGGRRAPLNQTMEVGQLNELFQTADFNACAMAAEAIIRTDCKDLSDADWGRRWIEQLRLVSTQFGLREYVVKTPMTSLRKMTDDQILMLHNRARMHTTAFQLESERRALLALGKRPIATHLDLDLPGLIDGAPEIKIIEIAIPEVVIPRLSTIKDLIDFVSRDEYAAPIRRLRAHVQDLATSTKSIAEISEEMFDDLHELDRQVQKEKLERYFGICQFVFGTAFGLVEDILKVRLESAAKRPFEIGEKIAEQRFYAPSYGKDPLFMVWAVNDKYGPPR
ncbi:hypothetical protein [Bradyrhizobium sp. CCGUVB14]|uniref:hypothetical protein n=1 Tax=Bradyrhizobium sp. CCGUVB14 TaxID=2949628 RepID=UPI0020B2D1FB|nr:hypothetical protein [Bradyrhizobium sp. CCGUVB14]MCP3444860.1 hypothetical protein [Bradyrhizobium sp. CCGUVB14]